MRARLGAASIASDANGDIRGALTGAEQSSAGALWTSNKLDMTEMAAVIEVEVGRSGASPGATEGAVGPDGVAPALQSTLGVFLSRNTGWVQGTGKIAGSHDGIAGIALPGKRTGAVADVFESLLTAQGSSRRRERRSAETRDESRGRARAIGGRGRGCAASAREVRLPSEDASEKSRARGVAKIARARVDGVRRPRRARARSRGVGARASRRTSRLREGERTREHSGPAAAAREEERASGAG